MISSSLRKTIASHAEKLLYFKRLTTNQTITFVIVWCVLHWIHLKERNGGFQRVFVEKLGFGPMKATREQRR